MRRYLFLDGFFDVVHRFFVFVVVSQPVRDAIEPLSALRKSSVPTCKTYGDIIVASLPLRAFPGVLQLLSILGFWRRLPRFRRLRLLSGHSHEQTSPSGEGFATFRQSLPTHLVSQKSRVHAAFAKCDSRRRE